MDEEEFDIGHHAEDLGLFYIFSRFWLPIVGAVILSGIAFFLFVVFLNAIGSSNQPHAQESAQSR